MNKLVVAASCMTLGLAVALPSASAGPPRTPEQGCFDIVPGSTLQYASLYTEGQARAGETVLDEPTVEQREIVPGGLVTVDLELAAPSCPDASYVLTVYAALPGPRGQLQLLETFAVPGTGSSDGLRLETIVNDLPETTATQENDPRYCVQVLLSTVDAGGRTVDQADDGGPASACKKGDGSGGFTYGG